MKAEVAEFVERVMVAVPSLLLVGGFAYGWHPLAVTFLGGFVAFQWAYLIQKGAGREK